MKRYTFIIIGVLAALSMRAQTSDLSLLVPADAQNLGTAKLTSSVVQAVISDNKFDLDATYGFWAPESVNNVVMGAKVSTKLNKRIAFSFDARQIADSKPSYGVNELGAPTGEFTPKNLILGAGVAYRVLPNLAVGVEARMLNSQLAKDIKGNLFAVDASVAYISQMLDAEVGAVNIGSRAAYAKMSVDAKIQALKASAEVDYLLVGALMASVGLEYSIKDIAFLRAGYHYGDKEKALPSFAACGLGLKFFGVTLNASYLLASKTLGGTMLFGLGYEF